MYKKLQLFLLISLCFACKEESLPKPKAYLDLTYPEKSYKPLFIKKPYTFLITDQAVIKKEPNDWLKILYPKLKASIDITYFKVDNNVRELIQESEKLVFEHTIKAEKISSKDFLNTEKKVFGTLYEISGNAASQIQFHLTDSSRNFMKGALYFYAKPNYDSVLPAVDYIKKDIIKLIETLEWKEN